MFKKVIFLTTLGAMLTFNGFVSANTVITGTSNAEKTIVEKETNIPSVVRISYNDSNNVTNTTTMIRTAEQMREAQLQKENSQDITSTDDNRRRAALEKTYNIKLAESDTWFKNSDSDYTAFDTLKNAGYYAINANRQELILFGWRTKDWQPYRAYSATLTPAYFELVNGKYEYSKIYWADRIQNLLSHNASVLSMDMKAETTFEPMNQFKEYLTNLRNANGVMPLISGINHDEKVAAKYDISEPSEDYYESKYANAKVVSEGTFE